MKALRILGVQDFINESECSLRVVSVIIFCRILTPTALERNLDVRIAISFTGEIRSPAETVHFFGINIGLKIRDSVFSSEK